MEKQISISWLATLAVIKSLVHSANSGTPHLPPPHVTEQGKKSVSLQRWMMGW